MATIAILCVLGMALYCGGTAITAWFSFGRKPCWQYAVSVGIHAATCIACVWWVMDLAW